MTIIADNSISSLLESYRSGYSLEQDFYCDDSVFDMDKEKVLENQWHMAGHTSMVPNRGDYFLFKVLDEELIIVRESEEKVNAFYNVCRHRGSRVCLEAQGRKRLLTCPYHAWSYDLDGSLKVAQLMDDDFDKSENGLHKVALKELEGLLFVCIGDNPDDFEEDNWRAGLQLHDIANAKIARRLELPTAANWKLVVENFLECYHCKPSHPEYCSVHSPAKLLAVGAGPDSGPAESQDAYFEELYAWREKAKELGVPVFENSETIMRGPIREGFLTESKDGQPVAPLMGKFRELGAHDEGTTVVAFNHLNVVIASSDHAVMFRFTPLSTLSTDVEAIWLVAPDAEEGKDYDPARVSWVWDVTLAQDAIITEDNQAGILSRRYQPGRYSRQENGVVKFIDHYIRQLRN